MLEPHLRLIVMCLLWCAMLVGAALGQSPAHAQLRGHGGSIRALAVSVDGMTALSGSFDASAIRWSLATTSPSKFSVCMTAR
jgi:cytochrome c